MIKISKYPTVERDLNITVPKYERYGSIEAKILEADIKEMEDFRLIGIYYKEEEKVFTFRFYFNSYEKTLTSKEVDKLIERIYGIISSI